MSIANLTPTQLREAADLLEKIAQLQNQLEHLHGSEAAPVAGPPTKPAKRKMTAAHIAKIVAAEMFGVTLRPNADAANRD